MILKHTHLVAASVLLMTTLVGTPSFAANSCETDPDWECIELPIIEEPLSAKEAGHVDLLVKDGKIPRATKIIAPPRPKDGSPKLQELPKK